MEDLFKGTLKYYCYGDCQRDLRRKDAMQCNGRAEQHVIYYMLFYRQG